MSSSEWAAWVQAIGSVAAILFAGLFVWWQHELQEKRAKAVEAEERAELLTAYVDLCSKAAVSVQVAFEHFSGSGEATRYFADVHGPSDFDGLSAAFEILRSQRLFRTDLQIAFLRAHRSFEAARGDLRDQLMLKAPGFVIEAVRERLRRAHSDIATSLDQLTSIRDWYRMGAPRGQRLRPLTNEMINQARRTASI